jgi:hypothetical protein
LTKPIEELTDQNESLKEELETYSSVLENLSAGPGCPRSIPDGSPEKLKRFHDNVIDENVQLRKQRRGSVDPSLTPCRRRMRS